MSTIDSLCNVVHSRDYVRVLSYVYSKAPGTCAACARPAALKGFDTAAVAAPGLPVGRSRHAASQREAADAGENSQAVMCERDFTLTCAIRAERGQRGPKACRAPASDGSLAAAMLRATRGPHFGCYHPSVCLVDGRADGRRLQSVPNPRHATCQQAAAPCMAPPHRPCRPESATRSADLSG